MYLSTVICEVTLLTLHHYGILHLGTFCADSFACAHQLCLQQAQHGIHKLKTIYKRKIILKNAKKKKFMVVQGIPFFHYELTIQLPYSLNHEAFLLFRIVEGDLG